MKLLLILFLLLSTSVWSKVTLELKLEESSVKQGQIVSGSLRVLETDGTAALSGLKDKTLGKTLYIQKISAFMKRQDLLEAEVRVIFIKPPESNSVSEEINSDQIVINWNGIEVAPVESKSFLFGDFEVPEKINWQPWILSLALLLLLSAIGIVVRQRLDKRSKYKSGRRKLKEEILSCSTYDDIVHLWRHKRQYLETFPELEKEFKTLEDVLFRYQFKPQRTEQEVLEVTSAYQNFKTNAAGALHGV